MMISLIYYCFAFYCMAWSQVGNLYHSVCIITVSLQPNTELNLWIRIVSAALGWSIITCIKSIIKAEK